MSADSGRDVGLVVGLVVVSHSRPLARAAVALAAEMVHGRPFRVAIAAGLDEVTFGTDASEISRAIEAVDGPDGVVVLMDLGSAVLSAELALDLLDDDDLRDRVILCPAPLVEGLVVAAVAAAGGAGATEVAAEARSALMGKVAHLQPGSDSTLSPTPVTDAADCVAEVVVETEHGLHARPAARLVAAVRGLDAEVTIRNVTTSGPAVPAASLSRVATLAALTGHRLEVRARGPQAAEAIEHVVALAARRFDEPTPGPAAEDRSAAWTSQPGSIGQRPGSSGPQQVSVGPRPGSAGPQQVTVGPRPGSSGPQQVTVGPRPGSSGPQPAAPGIGIGPLTRLAVETPDATADPHEAAPPPAQWRRVVEALADVRRDVERLRALTGREAGPAEAGVFDAHLMLLDDAEILATVKGRIAAGAGAARAWAETMQAIEAEWAGLPDSYLRGRAEDVAAIADQVLWRLLGGGGKARAGAGVLVATTLTAADVVDLDVEQVKGIVLTGGSATSHVAILARSKGIPAVVAAGPDILGVADGTMIVIDGTAGRVVVDPSLDLLHAYQERAERLAAAARQDLLDAALPAITRDGTAVHVVANVASVADARAAAAAGADGVGLLRTEFLFQDRDREPDAGEQERVYRSIASTLGGRPVVVRTLDVGGDKPLPFLPLPSEDNPFLGLRGIRVGLAHPRLLTAQLQAICRTAADHPIRVMFPMVTTVDELVRARELLDSLAGTAGSPDRPQVGIMVEVPAVALALEPFLPYLDFVSIGTNDLTQYTLAAERGNPAVAGLFDPLHPAVLRLVAATCRAAGRLPVAVCGEMAADPAAIPLLLGLGVTELSVSAPAVPGVKREVRSHDLPTCARLAARALDAAGPAEVRVLVAAMASLATADR